MTNIVTDRHPDRGRFFRVYPPAGFQGRCAQQSLPVLDCGVQQSGFRAHQVTQFLDSPAHLVHGVAGSV